MPFRDWLSRLSLSYTRLTGRPGSWPWLVGLAAVAFLFLVASTGSLSAVAELPRQLGTAFRKFRIHNSGALPFSPREHREADRPRSHHYRSRFGSET